MVSENHNISTGNWRLKKITTASVIEFKGFRIWGKSFHRVASRNRTTTKITKTLVKGQSARSIATGNWAIAKLTKTRFKGESAHRIAT